jgi:uncharacterized protein YndB with AHSA1/START domain
MTTPDVPLRMELTFNLPGTPEQVWQAVATANGISGWFLPTDMEERAGGAVLFHMGEDDSRGTITGWDPPHRLEFEEPEWAALTGHESSSVTPMVTEFLVEAESGGTCVLRVVSSAFGSGSDWEQEFFHDMQEHWAPFFDNLRLYLTHFPGQRVTSLSLTADVPGPVDDVWSAVRDALGAVETGADVEVRDLSGRVERISSTPGVRELLVRLMDPLPGYVDFSTHSKGDGVSAVSVEGYLFSDAAPAYVERERPVWKAWLESLAVPAR